MGVAPMVADFPERSAVPNEQPRPCGGTLLVIRNVSVHEHRTSIRLEPEIWDTLAEICRRECCSLRDVCSYVAERKPPHGSLASSLRIFSLDYFRRSATEDGHRSAGHGQGMFLSQQQQHREMRTEKAKRSEPPDGLTRGP